ncbi:hypothetical protein TTHERM_00188940 (macronuclear) [Tetrahymena thermophila SB210]|uniref:Uncharacterized protein n=1 Tax=Tetrahymena thermophila (strain SB210) TaxID=312017 RepID=I7MJG7_TETTS|nr:hypothetical protein TTHERM_00188940 [Tetrahymena thermophila SB210]EAR96325.2 hypothetical protein TTHERM_00188940 [Tetrahymena thermophila SB210]|eukprot:XP_001016570.2 hypothetical protein TTHERM_00188940 [Tetrahymena thermophila SB210]
MNRNHMQVLAPLTSQRSYRDIRQRQNGLQQIINSSNNSSFLNNSTAHTRNNSGQSSNLTSNNVNHIQMSNSIHQISHKPQPNTQTDRRRNNSSSYQVPNQEFSSTEGQNNKIQVCQQNIPFNQDMNQKLHSIKRNQSTEQIDAKQYLQKSIHQNADHYGKQTSHQRVNSECESEQNKENISFCVNSVQSNTQRNYSYETSFNSKTIQPEKSYFMPLKQQQQMQKQIRRNTNMSTDFSNHNNSQRQTTNSQNNSGSYNQNLNSYNSNQMNQAKKNSDGLGKLLASQLNDLSLNNNIIESYIEKVFQKDLSLQSEQGGFQPNQGHTKETEQSFNKLNLQSEHSEAQKSLNQSNYNSDQSIQDKRTQQQSQIQSQLQSQILYEQALQQKLKLLPQSKENKNTSSFTQIPKPFNKFQEHPAYNQVQLKNLNKYLFGDNQDVTQITKQESNQINKQQELNAQKLINSKELIQKTLQSDGSNDDIEQSSLLCQQEKEIISQHKHSKQNENQKDLEYGSYNSINQIQNNSSVYNQNIQNQAQQELKIENQNLQNKMQELEQKQSQLQQTLIQKVMQINCMENQINQLEKDKKLMQQSLDQIQQQLNDEMKKQQEFKLANESLQEINQKQIKTQQDLNLQIQQLNFQIFQLEQQIYDVNVNAKEKEKALEHQKNEQILLLKDKFEKDFEQLNEQHSKLVQLQNICMNQKETLSNENQFLHSQLEQKQSEIQQYQTKISAQEMEIKNLEQKYFQSNSSNHQIQFIEQQLADAENELNNQNKKFNMVVLNISTVLELIQQKIQNYQTTIKMTDRSINFQNLSEQLMSQVKFGINQMALLIQPIIQEIKEQSQVQRTFRQNTSFKNLQDIQQTSQSIQVAEDKKDQIQCNKKIEVQNPNGIQDIDHIENKTKEQIDLKNVQTAQFGEQSLMTSQNQRELVEKQQKQEIAINDQDQNQNGFKVQNCNSISQLINNQTISIQEYIIPQSDTQIQIQNIKNRIYQRQQRRKQNESSYSSNRSFSYNSNQSNNFFTVGRQNLSFQDDNNSSPYQDQHQSQI